MDPCENSTADFEPALQAFAYFLGSVPAVYVSAPINTGWRFLTWYKEKGRKLKGQPTYSEAHARDVVAANCKHVAATIAEIKRREHPAIVIDPTSLDVPSWTQHDYRCFWGKVIQRFVSRAIFLNGWEASAGCVYEFSVSKAAGVQCFDENRTPISTGRAVQLIQGVVSAMTALDLEAGIFRLALSRLRSDTRPAATGTDQQ